MTVNIDVNNASTNGPVTVSGGTVSLNATNLISEIRASHNLFDTIILSEYNQPATYDYRIVVQQTGSSNGQTLQFGTGTTFNDFPMVKAPGGGCTGDCVANTTAFDIALPSPATPNFFASDYTSAYTVTGRFNVVTVSSGGGGGAATPTPTPSATPAGPTAEQLASTNTQLSTQLNSAPTTGPLPTELVTAITNALSSSAGTSQDAATQVTSQPTATALNTLTTINNTLNLAGTAAERGAAVSTTSAATTIGNLATAIGALSTSRSLSTEEVAQVNTLVTNTLASATKLVSGTGTTTESILQVVKASSDILAKAAAASGAAVSTTLVTQVTQLAAAAVSSVITKLPATVTQNVPLTTTTQVQDFLRANPAVLDVALEAAAVLPSDAKITIGGAQLTVAEILALNLGGGGGTAGGIASGLNFLTATSGYTVTTDSVTGNMTLVSATEKYVAAKPQSRLVPASIPNGISFLADGTALLVGNGVATELAPTAFDSNGFKNAVSAAGYQLTYRDNGTVSIALTNNERFSGAFGFDNLGAASSCGSIGITSPTGSPATASYAFTVVCANGPRQRVTPIPDATAFYSSVADAGLNISTDRNTGIITIATVGKLKPSFFVTPLSSADTTYLNANKNSRGVAFRSKDANGDGRLDYDVITADGVQLFYGMP